MVTKNGGYAIVTHDDKDIHSKVGSAYATQKPILFYDDDNTCYFIDTIKKNDDGDYILTKGGKTFTVTTNNTLSSEGEIQTHLYRYDIYLSYDDINENTLTARFNILSNVKLSLNDENIFEFLYNNYKYKNIVGVYTYDNSVYGIAKIEGSILDNIYFNFDEGDSSNDPTTNTPSFEVTETQLF